MDQDDASVGPASGPVAVGVRFRPAGKIYEFDPGPLILRRDDRVLVETERGPELGTIVITARPLSKPRALQRVIKKADARDLGREDQNFQRERESYRSALEHVRGSGLPMKLVKAERTFDGTKTTFYFFAEDRVDFRELARTLAQSLGTRVEMKQIGARDEAKVSGGLGVCGRELCCSSWLQEIDALTVTIVKEQRLALHHSMLAGQCRRLTCCMRNQYQTYLELNRGLTKAN